MKKVLVTGGAGFVGRHLVKDLLNRNWDVTIVDALVPGTGAISPEFGWPLFEPRDYDNFNFLGTDCRDFFIENKDYDVYEGNEALVGKYYVVTFDTSDPYLFYDCGPLGDSERRQGEGRPASIGFQLLSVKKL